MQSRRTFLKAAARGAAGWIILADSRSARGAPANGKLDVALIGVGKRGSGFVHSIPRAGENLAALCDVDLTHLAEPRKRVPRAQVCQDFRKMLDEVKIDAAVVATPDHSHAVISAAAMKRGKHVYCEKPIAHDVGEARALREIAKACRVVGDEEADRALRGHHREGWSL